MAGIAHYERGARTTFPGLPAAAESVSDTIIGWLASTSDLPLTYVSGRGYDSGMWIEARHVMAIVGDDVVTVVAFCALLLFGVTLLIRHGAGTDRIAAIGILCVATLWLLFVMAGILRGDLARWSPLSVLLLAIGIETRPRDRHVPKASAAPDEEAIDRQSICGGSLTCDGIPQPDVACQLGAIVRS